MNMPFESEKHAKFVEFTEKRTNRALDAICLIGNLSRHQLHSWDDRGAPAEIPILEQDLFCNPMVTTESYFSSTRISRVFADAQEG